MSKFYVGQKVRVLDSSLCRGDIIPPVGSIGTIAVIDNDDTVKLEEYNMRGNWLGFSRIEPITETPKGITLNGATYLLKEDQKHEHEWKFGDIAVHEEYGVGIVVMTDDEDGEFYFAQAGDNEQRIKWVVKRELTLLRRSNLSV